MININSYCVSFAIIMHFCCYWCYCVWLAWLSMTIRSCYSGYRYCNGWWVCLVSSALSCTIMGFQGMLVRVLLVMIMIHDSAFIIAPISVLEYLLNMIEQSSMFFLNRWVPHGAPKSTMFSIHSGKHTKNYGKSTLCMG